MKPQNPEYGFIPVSNSQFRTRFHTRPQQWRFHTRFYDPNITSLPGFIPGFIPVPSSGVSTPGFIPPVSYPALFLVSYPVSYPVSYG